MQNSKFHFCIILKNKWYHAKVLLKRFHLNGHTTGFRQQTQKLELHYMSPLLTLGVKELWNVCIKLVNSHVNVLPERGTAT